MKPMTEKASNRDADARSSAPSPPRPSAASASLTSIPINREQLTDNRNAAPSLWLSPPPPVPSASSAFSQALPINGEQITDNGNSVPSSIFCAVMAPPEVLAETRETNVSHVSRMFQVATNYCSSTCNQKRPFCFTTLPHPPRHRRAKVRRRGLAAPKSDEGGSRTISQKNTQKHLLRVFF